jgi:peptidoglycan/LPS O-acetylase OafA/YrhL
LLGAALVLLLMSMRTLSQALDPETRTGPTSIFWMPVGLSLVSAVAGVLTLFRRRRQLIHQLLGSATTGSFALALVFLSRSDGDGAADGLLTVAVIIAGLSLITVVFEDQISPQATP